MPTYQIYFPEKMSADVVELAAKDKMNIREWVRTVVGNHIQQRKKTKKPQPTEDQE